jgi:hypothetical protein
MPPEDVFASTHRRFQISLISGDNAQIGRKNKMGIGRCLKNPAHVLGRRHLVHGNRHEENISLSAAGEDEVPQRYRILFDFGNGRVVPFSIVFEMNSGRAFIYRRATTSGPPF